MKNIMDGRTMYVLFYVLGPENSPFTIPAVQLTDSPYVAHSENILYRQGYNEFVRQGEKTYKIFQNLSTPKVNLMREKLQRISTREECILT
jgi:Phosphoenolpyruvate carboxykinase (GTP)